MKRRLLLFLAIVVSGALPLSAWADVSIVKTTDGTEFKFGLSSKTQILTLKNLDLMGGNTNFTSFISPNTALGDQDIGIHQFGNLLFTLERGPLRIHANLEMEATLDAASVDVNNINLERLALYYKFPTIGTLAAGFDVHAFDPEGGLIYTDEHPGLWLIGGDDDISWDFAWHLVTNCNRGLGLTNLSGAACSAATAGSFAQQDTGLQSQLFMARGNFAVGDGTVVSPMIVYYRRHQPLADGVTEFSDPLGVVPAGLAFGTGDIVAFGEGSYQDQFRPGASVVSDVGSGITLTGQVVGLLGKVNAIDAAYLGGVTPAGGLAGVSREDFDLQSWALFFEVAMDGSEIGLPPGLTPYVNFEYHSGDGDPFDDKYTGYVAVSNLSQALRKDGFKGQSIASYGPSTLGAGSSDGWGFETTSRGTGPDIGGILPDELVGGDGTTFNNRGGKGGNAGFFKIAGGVGGKIDSNWDTHAGFNVMWYASSDPLQAEAAQNCIARETVAPGSTPFGGAGGCGTVAGLGVSDPVSVRAAQGVLASRGVDLDSKYMGFEFNANVGYTFSGGLRASPYFSVFVPGSVVEEISAAYLSTGSSLLKTKETAFTLGFEFSAAF
jgi:hypothetical protein